MNDVIRPKIIQVDSRQQTGKHELKHKYFESVGYRIIVSKMLCGDYCIPSNGSIVVDTKKDINELYLDLVSQHERFSKECLLAQDAGIKLYILVENKNGITSIEDITKTKNGKYLWVNPMQYVWVKKGKQGKPPVGNPTLKKIMLTMTEKYGVEFLFCTPEDSGEKILTLLNSNV